YVGASMLTHDPDLARDYDRDPLISRNIAVNILLGLFDASSRLVADAGAIRIPALTLSAGSDYVVSQPAPRRFHEGLSSEIKAMEVYDGFRHAVFHEKDRERPIARAREFIQQAFELPVQGERPVERFTRDEHERLSRPLPLHSPRRVGYACMKLFMKTLGRLSDGIRLGWRTPLPSAHSLAYLYHNPPPRTTPPRHL